MKNRFLQFFIAILVVLFFGCSTSSDGNGNSTTTVVPLAPSNLQGVASSTSQINLSWTDNSTNETGFKIERRTGSANYAVVGTVNADVLLFSDTGLTPNTTYIYRVYAFNSVGKSITYSNEVTITTLALPILTTTAATSITQTTATSGGTISSDGGSAITARGVCWSTSTNPSIALPTKTTDGTGIGAFTSNLTGLSANTTYYVRAYATNSLGVGYGNEINFTTPSINVPGPNVTDIDGNTYQSVTNCGLTFTKQNLNVSKYSDGTPIPQVTDPTQWANLSTGAWCYYNNDPVNSAVYGKLYNWYAVAGIYDAASIANPALRKNLAPAGWHVPSDGEWSSLINCLDPNADGGNIVPNLAGGKMKTTGTIQAGTGLWQSPNTDATNVSGFSGLPAGYRDYDGTFYLFGSFGIWWSSSEFLISNVWTRHQYSNLGSAFRNTSAKEGGFSLRCLRD
jgi:uncharacterized protein (TIGR02145 family)